MANITGRVEITVNGKLLLNKAGAIARGIGQSGLASFERTSVQGDSGHHGYIDTPIMAECEVTVTDRDDIVLSEFATINGDGTVVFRARGGGKSYIMYNATCLGNFELTAGEGETSLRFQGATWIETTS
jgi:hypothetical protein